MYSQPSDVVNLGLDSLGADPIGSLDDGTRVSEAARRHYGPTLRGLLRAAHWAWARKQAPLQLLGDATGQTPNTSGIVEPPWNYAYAWPNDGVHAIWMPWQSLPASTSPPQMTGLATTNTAITTRPARFLIGSSEQYPVAAGEVDWTMLPEPAEGVALRSRRVVLTNVQKATLVYTKLALEIEEWDALFLRAMAAALADRLALVAIDDKKLAFQLRTQQIAIAKEAIAEARVANANDSGFPQTADHTPDWFQARRGGGGGWWPGWSEPGNGILFQGWATFGFGDGSVF